MAGMYPGDTKALVPMLPNGTHVANMLTLYQCVFLWFELIVLSIVHVYSCWRKFINEILSTGNTLVRFVATVRVLELHYFWTKSREYCTNCV